MKKYITFLNYAFILILVIAGCKKIDFPTEAQGEALGEFMLKAPVNDTTITLNAATPNQPITIEWTAARKGVTATPKYKWIAALQSGGSLSSPILELVSDNGGADPKLTITHKQLDDALAAKNIAANQTANLIWSIVADNGGTKVQANQVFNISIKRFGDGVTPFVLYGPAPSTTNLEIDPSSTTNTINFKWQKANPASTTKPVTYEVLFAREGSSFANPLFTIKSDNNGSDSALVMTYKQINDSLVKYGLTNLGEIAKLNWTVRASSGTFPMMASFVNTLYLLRQVNFYLVGSINGWNINSPLELIVDKKSDRNGKVFYSYVQLNAGDEFKFFKTKGDWGSGYGNNGTSGTGFSTGYNVGGNFQISTSGVYRLTIDTENNKAYVQQKQVGLVGGMQGWDPSNPIFGGLVKKDQFIIIATMGTGEIFKFHDGPEWNNSTPDRARWWGKAIASSGLTGALDYDGNGDNLSNSTGAGRIRAIWDGTNPQQVRYELNAAAEMRVVGDGIQGVAAWNPGASPQMTYMGNGRWQITLDLIGGRDIKFLAGNDWGAFDYEDASNGSTATGTARKIRWDGNNNFKTPVASGNYTITLDEHAQTVTIN